MNFNFFDWIRDGVKQSVLLGISDAAECIGTQKEVDHVNQQLFLAIRKSSSAALASPGPSGGGRKSLGRSLQQIMDSEEKPAD